ncbi:hypothetical protein Lal_00041696, partial [Lupinus albus]
GGGSNNNVVLKGYLAVSVGEDLKRFIIPTEEAEEKLGFQQISVFRNHNVRNATQQCVFQIYENQQTCELSSWESRLSEKGVTWAREAHLGEWNPGLY